MSDDKLIHPPAIDPGAHEHLPAEQNGAAPPMLPEEHYFPAMEQAEGGIDVRRYAFAVLRYKWLLALSMVVGLAGAYFVWTTTQVTYTAEGNLWIANNSTTGNQAIARIDTITHEVEEISVAGAYGITVDSQGRVWMTFGYFAIYNKKKISGIADKESTILDFFSEDDFPVFLVSILFFYHIATAFPTLTFIGRS